MVLEIVYLLCKVVYLGNIPLTIIMTCIINELCTMGSAISPCLPEMFDDLF